MFLNVSSLSDDLRTESAGWRTGRHQRNDRLSNGSLSARYELLVSGRRDDSLQREVLDDFHGEQLPNEHETYHQELDIERLW